MSNPIFDSSIFLLGCAGAMAPEIVRLYKLRENADQFNWSWFYLIISFVFAALGGLLAWILPTTTYYGAFYAGVTTPIIVTTILKKASAIKSKDKINIKNKEITEKRVVEVTGERNSRKKDGAASGVVGGIITTLLNLLSDLLSVLSRMLSIQRIPTLIKNYINAF